MRALTKDLGRLVYNVENEPLPTSNNRRSGGNNGFRRITQSVPRDSVEQISSTIQCIRSLSSDEDADGLDQITSPQHTVRVSIAERTRLARRRTNSDDSLTHSTTVTSSFTNRVEHFFCVFIEQ